MRHLFVTNDFPPKRGGIESYVLGLCAGLDAADVMVVAPARKDHEESDARLPFRVVRLPVRMLRANSRVAKAVAEAAAAHRADVIHLCQALPLGRLTSHLAREAGRLTTVFVYGAEILVPSKAPFVRSALQRVLRSADLVVSCSAFTRDAVTNLTSGAANVEAVLPAVDAERFSLSASGARVRDRYRLGGGFVAVFVGRLVKRKGADMLVRAVAETPDLAALVVGGGPEEGGLRRLAAELEVADRVAFAGHVPDEHLPEHYAAGDVFCMPVTDRYGGIDTEGFGIVYLEAASSGLPCVAGRSGGVEEAVVHEVTGLILDDPDPSSLASALQRLAVDEALRTRMGAVGRERVESDFTPQVQAARLEKLVAATADR